MMSSNRCDVQFDDDDRRMLQFDLPGFDMSKFDMTKMDTTQLDATTVASLPDA
jgi:hypothetical protein